MIIGSGSQQFVVKRLLADFPGRVEHHEWLDPGAVSETLDDSTVLVLPSWPEGLGRVIIESFARGRAVVATDAGGIPDLVTHGVEGLLVPPADPITLASRPRPRARRPRACRADGSAARARYARLALDAGRARARDAGAGRRDDRRHRPLSVRLLFVTQKIDADHPVLAQTVDVVRELAARFDAVDVLWMRSAATICPRTSGSAPSAGRRASRAGSGSRAAWLPLCCPGRRAERRADPYVPLFALLAAPLVKPLRIPMLLWYTHWNPSRSLRLALPLVDVVMSVSPGSFPIETPKLQATGHAIDVEQFAPAPTRGPRPAAPARPGAHGALEGLRHDARGGRLVSPRG